MRLTPKQIAAYNDGFRCCKCAHADFPIFTNTCPPEKRWCRSWEKAAQSYDDGSEAMSFVMKDCLAYNGDCSRCLDFEHQLCFHSRKEKRMKKPGKQAAWLRALGQKIFDAGMLEVSPLKVEKK